MTVSPTVLSAASAQVTEWPQRLLLTAVFAAVVVVLVAALALGWRRRMRAQRDVPAPMFAPMEAVSAPSTAPDTAPEGASAAALLGPWPGRYLASTRSSDWLDRIVVHGLGVPSKATVTVLPTGVWWQREGARDVFVPSTDLLAARLDRGIAGAVYEDGGVVVVTWRLGDLVVDTGFRAQHFSRHDEIVAALERIAAPTPSTGPPTGPSTGSSMGSSTGPSRSGGAA